MKHSIIFLMAVLMTALFAFGANAQDTAPGHGVGNGVCQFIDEDGDGFNDLAPDADGDGIPNGLDPDFVKPEDGDGLMNRYAHKYGELFRRYFGEDVVAGTGGLHYGPGDGTGMSGMMGTGDGTGFGPGIGSGDSPGDGTGEGTMEMVQENRGDRR